jgi:hypothetical protein
VQLRGGGDAPPPIFFHRKKRCDAEDVGADARDNGEKKVDHVFVSTPFFLRVEIENMYSRPVELAWKGRARGLPAMAAACGWRRHAGVEGR